MEHEKQLDLCVIRSPGYLNVMGYILIGVHDSPKLPFECVDNIDVSTFTNAM